jgi:hypothetical protein
VIEKQRSDMDLKHELNLKDYVTSLINCIILYDSCDWHSTSLNMVKKLTNDVFVCWGENR